MKKKILAGILAFTVCMCGFSESVSASDNRTAYLERYGEYFDIYSCVAEFSNGSTVYSYLVKDKNDVEKIVPETGFKLKDVITLSQNELYYTLNPDKTDEYKAQFENDQESKPFMVTVVVRDENSGETKYYSVGSRDEAKKKAEELCLSEGEYEIEEKWAGGAAAYSYEPEQYDKVRTVQYLDENYKVIDTVELSGKNFAYNVADGTEHIRFVSGTEPADTTCEIMPGDIYSDGKIDVTDLTELSLYLLGDRELTENQQKSADVDSDGAVTLADLARLRQYLSKKIDTLETSYSPEDITDKCRTIIANASYVISGEPCFMVSSMEEYNERIARYEMEAEQIKEQGVTIDEKFFENNRLAVIVDNSLSANNVVFTQTAVKLDEKGNVHLYYNRDFLHFGSEIAGLLHHITIVPGNPHNDSKAYVHFKDIMPVTDLTDKCLITNSSAVGYTGKDTFPVSTGMITSMEQFKEQFTDNGIDPYGAVKELGISDEFFKDHFLFYHTKYETTDNPKSRITSVRIDKDMNLTMDITTRTNVTEDPSGIPVSVGNSVMVNWFLAAAVPKAEVDPSEVASVDFIGISETETIK